MELLPFTIGDVVAGKFRLERVVGRGGMGVVVAATHLELDELVALKFLHPDLLDSPERISRFTQEARAAARLKGINVARVFDVGTLDGSTPFIVMEYLEGEDLRQMVKRRGPLPPAEAVAYVIEACIAMAEAHARGIVHRDLKPRNLFATCGLDGKPLVKVLDFGICKFASGSNPDLGETRADATMGSPNFISPEQMRSARNVDTRTDVWAIGAVLYYLLSGRAPFAAETLPELCLKVLNDPPEPLGDDVERDPVLESVLLGCLEKDPNNRSQSMGELAHALAPFAEARGAELIARAEQVLAESVAMGPEVSGDADDAEAGAALDHHVATGATLGTAVPDVAANSHAARKPIVLTLGAAALALLAAVMFWPGSASDTPAASPVVEIDAATANPDATAIRTATPAIIVDAGVTLAPPDATNPEPVARKPRRRRARRRFPIHTPRPSRPPDAVPAATPPDAAVRVKRLERPDAAPPRPRLGPRDRRD